MVAATAIAAATKNSSPLRSSEKDRNSNTVAIPRRSHRSKEITSRNLSSSSSAASNSHSSPSSISRRFPSPLVTPRTSTPPALPQSLAPRRSLSVDRTRPTTTTTTRSLSVSFQGESFFYQTSCAKNSPRKATPERRRASDNPIPRNGDQLWPGANSPASNPLLTSLDCSLGKKDSILATIRLMQQSMMLDDGGDLLSSDTDSMSSGSNSGTPEPIVPPRAPAVERGLSLPARFWPVKKYLVDSQLLPRIASSPSRAGASQSRGLANPLRGRRGLAVSSESTPIGRPGNAPSIISFAAEVRRAKKGENRIEEAHMLRLLDNRHLQWRWVNARVSAAHLVHRLTAKNKLCSAWTSTSDLCDSVTIKRSKLQLLTQRLKLTSILKGQMTYLEEWAVIDRDHLISLSGVVEALKGSTLRLPVGSGAKADIQDVKEAVGSAVDIMQAMGSSICSLLPKVEGTNYLVSEVAKLAAQERILLDQSRDLLSTVVAMHVKQCSLQGHILQLKHRQCGMQL
ncbi:QWRF motif-containing protein 2-like [Typha latifolia]|uniref:QWRF motif-containing protein 2-like n=1 Tax=Typha latifolia TaxID=4733 RepID=UPI003C2FD12D